MWIRLTEVLKLIRSPALAPEPNRVRSQEVLLRPADRDSIMKSAESVSSPRPDGRSVSDKDCC